MLRFRAVLYLVLSIVVGRAARQAPRHFIPLKTRSLPNNPPTVRVVQYNTLADGLSGKRKDLGRFSRAKKPILDWENRKHGLLQEMLLHDPDIITCQEIDHYHDWFLPKLLRKGYYGLFAPKPISEVILTFIRTLTLDHFVPHYPFFEEILSDICALVLYIWTLLVCGCIHSSHPLSSNLICFCLLPLPPNPLSRYSACKLETMLTAVPFL